MTRRITPIFFLLAWPGLAGQNGEGLPAPTGVEASDGAYATKVGICWDHIRNATTYEVFRGTTDDAASATSVGATASIIFYDSTAEPAQNYFYWVRAHNGTLNRSSRGAAGGKVLIPRQKGGGPGSRFWLQVE